MSGIEGISKLHDCRPTAEAFRAEVLGGLRETQKRIPSKYFYDERGSRLFDRICQLDEYYPTRTELAIMRDGAEDMASWMGEHCLLIEYGSGSSLKTRILLDHLKDPVGYVPVDISREHLIRAALGLAKDYPGVPVLPVCADFTKPFQLPTTVSHAKRRIVYFPGSTIGNFTRQQAKELLAGVSAVCRSVGGLLIGIDLEKDPAVLEAAYNDSEQVTAAFNLNVLTHINRELGADFDVAGFRHRAVYNEEHGRIEMYLVSRADQVVSLDGEQIAVKKEEAILTEYSYKYSLEGFRRLAAACGLDVCKAWTDGREWFSVQYLTVRL